MKSIRAILLFVLSVSFVSCVMGVPEQKEPTQQDKVIAFVASSYDEYSRLANSIQKQDYIKEYETELGKILDSIAILTNWSGKIKYIHQTEYKNSISLDFTIECPISQYRWLTLSCQHILKNTDKETDRIYKQVYSMRDNLPVVFDGFVRKKRNGSLYWRRSDEEDKISYPKLYCHVTDIAPGSQKDTISDNLYQACLLLFDTVNWLRKKDMKQITVAQYNKQTAGAKKAHEAAAAKLTKDEEDYYHLVMQELFDDYVYGE